MGEEGWGAAMQEASDQKYAELCGLVSAKDGDEIHMEWLEYNTDFAVEEIPIPTLSLSMFAQSLASISALSVGAGNSAILCDMANKGDVAAYDICQAVAWSHVNNGANLSDEVRAMAKIVILRDRPKRTQSYKRKLQFTRRNRILCNLVEFLISDYGLYATRNDEKKGGKENSAIDYAVRSLAANDYAGLTYSMGKKAWNNRAHRRWAEMTTEARDEHIQRKLEEKRQPKPPGTGPLGGLGIIDDAVVSNFRKPDHGVSED